jgi:hypothetical protein
MPAPPDAKTLVLIIWYLYENCYISVSTLYVFDMSWLNLGFK